MAENAGGSGVLSRLRRAFSHNQDAHEAAELMADTQESGATHLSECCVGERAVVSGTIRSVLLQPSGTVPALEVEVYDGSGKLRVVWLGRRRMRGIDPGRMIKLSGRVTAVDGRPTMFNPRYELRPGPGQ